MVRVVYADLDPLVMAYARALLDSGWADATEHIEVGPEDPAALLEGVSQFLDMAEPVGVLLINSLDGLASAATAHVLDVLRGELPRGSCVAICQLTGATGRGLAAVAAQQGGQMPGLPHPRVPADVRALFGGLELVEPGVVPIPRWRPEPSPWQRLGPVDLWGGVGRVLRSRQVRGLR